MYRNKRKQKIVKIKPLMKGRADVSTPPFEGPISVVFRSNQPTWNNALILSPACATIQCPPLSTCVDAVCKCNADTLEENGVCIKGEKLLRRVKDAARSHLFIFWSVLIFSQLKRFRVNSRFRRLLLRRWATQAHRYSTKRPKTSRTK